MSQNAFDFVTADWHLGEDRFAIMQRPFKTVEEHDNAIIARHNELVKPDDKVLVVGDAVYKGAPNAVEKIGRMNGVKTLIRGNHDILPDEILSKYFERIVPEGQGIDFEFVADTLKGEVVGIQCYAVHYPTLARKDRFNIVGHIHGAWKYQLNSLNVGVDANHFYPHAVSQIPFFLKAVSEFYDDDVWAAYLEANVAHRATRGKKGSYFPPKAQ